MKQLLLFQFASLALCLCLTNQAAADHHKEKQILEVRTYYLVDEAAEEKLDEYLGDALIPALERQGLGPIGAFDQVDPAEDAGVQVVLLIPGSSVDAVVRAESKLLQDEVYLAAAKAYLDTPRKQAVVKRIKSELLESFDCWPKVTVPEQKKANKDRLFELRVYESSTEKLGQLKVEMFNAGEVPIFLASDIMPVFMGKALIGDKMPNLTYMTVFDDAAAQSKGWDAFRVNPDWKVLSKNKKYAGTVSKIHKSNWKPKSYSQL